MTRKVEKTARKKNNLCFAHMFWERNKAACYPSNICIEQANFQRAGEGSASAISAAASDLRGARRRWYTCPNTMARSLKPETTYSEVVWPAYFFKWQFYFEKPIFENC